MKGSLDAEQQGREERWSRIKCSVRRSFSKDKGGRKVGRGGVGVSPGL